MSAELDPLMRRTDVIKACALSQSSLYRLLRSGDFPQPVRITDSTVGWRTSEVADWIRARPRGAA